MKNNNIIFNIMDKESWERNEYFEHYFSSVPCTYSMTVRLDITQIKEKKFKLYPAMLYYLSTVVNRHSEFRTAFNEKGELGVYSEMMPCYTAFNKDTETFTNLWTEYSSDFGVFCKAYENDIQKYGKQKVMTGKPNVPSNCFTVSMIPWAAFEGFNLNIQTGYHYLKPIFTMGKYCQEKQKILMPLSIQVHHAVCDGFHICRFVNELQDLINN